MEAVTTDSVKNTIRTFIRKSINIEGIDDDEDLFESKLVNSLFSIQLVTFVEKTFQIKVTMDDLDIDNFKSVNSVHQFVMSKK